MMMIAIIVNSASWILNQYGVSSIPRDTSMCSYTGITCSTNGLTKIELSIDGYTSTGQIPLSTLTFTFPYLTSLMINRSSIDIPVADPTLNLFDKLVNLPVLNIIKIYNDSTLSNIPATFPTGLNVLGTLELKDNVNLVSFAGGEFPSHANLFTINIRGSPLQNFDISSTSTNLPRLNAMHLSFAVNNPKQLNFQQSSFPKLSTLGLYNDIGSPSITVIHNISIISVITLMGNNFHLNVVNTSKVGALKMEGRLSTFAPSIDQFPLMRILDITTSNLVTYPFTQFPIEILSINFHDNGFTSLPNLSTPKGLVALGLTNNDLQGQINFSLFQNTQLMALRISNNPQVSGTVPESFCSNYLIANNTGLSQIPDCFWCYDQDPLILSISPLQRPQNFICNVDYGSNYLYSNNGIVELRGRNLGWGYSDTEGTYRVSPVTPNIDMLIDFIPALQIGPPRNVSVRFHSFIGLSYPFTVVEAGINIGTGYAMSQAPNYTIVNLYPQFYNSYIGHNITLTFLSTGIKTSCLITSNTTNTIVCHTNQPVPFGLYNITLSNQYLNGSLSNCEFTQFYPIVMTVTTLDQIIKSGSKFSLSGYYSTSTPTVLFNTVNGNSSCLVTSFSGSDIQCTLQENIKGSQPSIIVLIDSYSWVYIPQNITTPYDQCVLETFNCHYYNNNGQCSYDGVCICSKPTFYNNCSIVYPIVSSTLINRDDQKLLTFYGDFGPFNQSNAIVLLNDTINCQITYTSQPMINCTLSSQPNPGLTSAKIQVDSLWVTIRDALLFKPMNNNNNSDSSSGGGPSSQDKCKQDTNDCYGHGYCDENGKCQCDLYYNQDDNCRTKFSNSTITPNMTSPTISFDIDGMKFSFEMYSIQEVGFDNQDLPIKELFVSDYNWSVNIEYSDSLNTTTIVTYQLNITNGTTNSTSPFYQLNVSSIVSFSKQPRDITFGDQVIHINPYAIKLEVGIDGWSYSSNLATLKVLFKTSISQDQTFVFDCEEKPLDSLQYDDFSSTIQYLRVVKDNIQFNGRFLDYVLSDGRPAYSKTELVSLFNTTTSSGEESIATIRVNLPQCKSCILDPDFSPLLIEKGNQDCNDKSNTWRIIVGVVVGGVALIAIATTTTILLKKKYAYIQQQKLIHIKLNSLVNK
ncbi:hypothetical protein DFA_09710 [Cavenderia fasciculata]|uniref:ComC supersandwich domain-containing protein n=1 Tax=Cavenderia fasciculata TaxID=261658 RepID=F4Q8D8_CACFS|nr:uncharacterized protein DFA_09710 [Cavenderia fasciculata]EGG16038.1 hypothetical protein DFA_09710 [Cavenderia fasciculata]|eukprot:XP_004352363.1 hypothetical protein DFA_09710 [Cavenderia fasciculata]